MKKINQNNKKYILDANGKSLGRLAQEAAIILRGKNNASFAYNRDSSNVVEIINVGKLKFTGNKLDQKKYYTHTGYVGNLKTRLLKDLIKEDYEIVVKKAIMGMLPKNKLRAKAMKRLILNK